MTDQPASLAEALARLQTDLPTITKASKAQYGSYANLTDVSDKLLPKLGSLGLSFSAKPTWVTREDGTRDFVLAYKLRHVSGESDEGEYPLGDKLASHQALGSAITYGRRYCLCAIIGAVAEEDDDGQAASSPPAAARGRQPRGNPPTRAAANLPRNADGTVSRSRVTEEELEASGNMTPAQLKEHNKLERDVKGINAKGQLVEDSGGVRLSAVPDDDPFYQPPLRTPQAAPSKAGAIQAYFKRFGFDDATPGDKESRLGALSAITGRKITSTNDLTAAEGIKVTDFLSKCRDRDALIERLAVKAGEDIG